jgi:hypothetical protein
MIDMGNKYKAIKCNIPNSTALVEDFARSGYELISVVKESNVLYVYWFKNSNNN